MYVDKEMEQKINEVPAIIWHYITQCCRQQAVSAIKASSVQLHRPSYQPWCKGGTTDIKVARRSSARVLKLQNVAGIARCSSTSIL